MSPNLVPLASWVSKLCEWIAETGGMDRFMCAYVNEWVGEQMGVWTVERYVDGWMVNG